MVEIKTLETIKALRSEADAFASFHADYSEKYASDNRCDKKGYGFGKDNRFSAFSIKTSFDSWHGYYGNSSCSSIMSVYHKDLVEPFVIQALNLHQKEIFATAARLMREKAASLTAKAAEELASLQNMLNDAAADLSVVNSEAAE